MTEPSAPPLCKCHDHPMRWNKDKRKGAGGFWACVIKDRANSTRRSRREGRPEFGSPEHLEKLSAAQIGRQHPPDCQHCVSQRGQGNASWNGDFVSYPGAHHRHRKAMSGMPCAFLDQTCKGPIQAALKHETDPSRLLGDIKVRMLYSTDSEDYMPLCSSHHKRYDLSHSWTVTMPAA